MNPMPKQANLMFISYIQPPKTLEGKGSSAKKKKSIARKQIQQIQVLRNVQDIPDEAINTAD